jgi:hypothetical protein
VEVEVSESGREFGEWWKWDRRRGREGMDREGGPERFGRTRKKVEGRFERDRERKRWRSDE